MRSTPYLCFLLPVICGGCRTAAAEVPVVGRADAGVFLESALIENSEAQRSDSRRSLSGARGAEPPVSPTSCPTGMVLVEGDYCPDVEQRCLEWMDPPGPYQFFRCKRYAEPAACKSKKRIHERFCIDEKERTEVGSDVPLNHQSWATSKKLCESSGARLCLTREWVFACEGEEMRPYPYGWARDSSVCNADIDHGLGRIGHLVDHRTPASAHPLCLSAFGIHDMAGNVDEWTTIDGAPRGAREVMHGSWWMPGRNSCRSFQGGHGASYEGTESGTRCCADAE